MTTEHSLTLSDVKITDYIPTIYTFPRSMLYKQNGKEMKCDFLAERDGVIIIIYNITRKVLVFVKQFRASVYLNNIAPEDRFGAVDVAKYPPEDAVTIELCAGLEDKHLPTTEIAREEILEECGYNVPANKLEKVASFKNGTETTGSISTLFYCEVTDDMKVSSGGGVDGENIEVIEMTIPEVKQYISQTCIKSPPNVLYGIYWFLENKCKITV